MVLEPDSGHRREVAQSAQSALPNTGIHTKDFRNPSFSVTSIKSRYLDQVAGFVSETTKRLNEVGRLPISKRPHAINISMDVSPITVLEWAVDDESLLLRAYPRNNSK
jgi:hypothetical protein